jgi:hypothetical protein
MCIFKWIICKLDGLMEGNGHGLFYYFRVLSAFAGGNEKKYALSQDSWHLSKDPRPEPSEY